MDLASGYSDSFNYGNGYTPLANNAIANNNLAYNANQNYANMAGMYNPFAQSGGFGAMTDYYSNAGAAYGRATGGFGGTPNAPQPSNPYASMPWWATFEQTAGRDAAQDWVKQQTGGGGIGSDAGQSPGQYQNPAVDWTKYFNGATSNQEQNPYAGSPGYDYNNPGTYNPQAAQSQIPNNPNMQQLLGYTPQQIYSGGGIGSDAARAPSQPGNVPNPYASQPWWNTFAAAAGPQGVSDWLTSQGVGGIGGNANTYGYPASGFVGGQDAFAGQPQQTPYGQGGIGSDTSRDALAWQLAQSSPWATSGAPANGPYPNMGYNPGMANSFANPAMQQYDWTKNNATLQQQMQDALKTIDGATGNQPAPPYGGALPPFWQGIRDATGMGAPQPTPAARPAEPWLNAS